MLAIITAAAPLVSIALAALRLGERLSSGSAQIVGETASPALMSAGIAASARYSPQAGREARRAAYGRHRQSDSRERNLHTAPEVGAREQAP